jgi:hypothetical protein
MANKQHKPEEIVTKLRQVEVLVGQGKARLDAIRSLRVRPETLRRITEFSEHESDGGELEEGERVAVEVFPVPG